MRLISRRKFLKYFVAGTSTAFLSQGLSGCKITEMPSQAAPTATSIEATSTLVPSSTAMVAPSATLTSTIQLPSPTIPAVSTVSVTPTPSKVDLAVVHGADPDQLVRKSIAALGGIEKFIKPGHSVIIKPNICVAYYTYEYAATTNPWVIAALVKLCLEAGAKEVRVMDFPFGGDPDQAYARSGIEKEVRAAGGVMELMSRSKFVRTEIPDGKLLKAAYLYEPILKADALINVPIAKHHNLTRLTLGLKNLMGVVLDRPGLHDKIGQRLADLSTRVRPTLTVVDAVRILVNHGPSGGSLEDVKKTDTLIASADPLAADSFATTLFGLKPDDIEYIRTGAAAGLGQKDLNSLRIEEINL